LTLLIQPGRKLHGAFGRKPSDLKPVIRPDLVNPLREQKLQFVRETIESALILCGGNRSLAADRLQISRQEIAKWVQRFRREDEPCASAE
jgi:DNA-binding NtrC family response regulator